MSEHTPGPWKWMRGAERGWRLHAGASDGQAALAAMRHAIATAEGRDQQEVQDEYANAAIARAKGKA